ncbi:MAG: alpha/beta hydrolase, partial [Pseudolysinimonas sp.]
MTVPTPHAAALAQIPVRAAEVTVLGSTTRYWEYGPSDAAQTILLVHGYRGDHHGLEPVIALL